MILGHTKNHVDGGFGLIKGRLPNTNATYTKEIFMRIDESGDVNRVVTAEEVKWVDWKKLLQN